MVFDQFEVGYLRAWRMRQELFWYGYGWDFSIQDTFVLDLDLET